jgi:hypothetical protein
MAKDFLGRDIDVAAIRESFKDTKGRELNLSDAVLENFIVGAGKRWTDLEDAEDPEKECCDLLEKAEQEAAKVSVSDPGITALVRKMDETVHAEIAKCIEAVVKGKTTAVDIYAQFRRVFSKDDMDAMPIPNTEAEHVGENQRPDKVKTKDHTGKPITVVWSNDFVSAMPEGKDFEGKLDDISKELKTPGSVPWLKGKGKADIKALQAEFSQKRNALRSMVKRAISLHHQWEAIATMPKIGLRWIRGTKEKGIVIPQDFGDNDFGERPVTVTLSPKPIWIYPKDEPENGREFSVTQFLAFDADMALNGEGQGTMADLVATAGRGTAATESEEGEGTGADMPEDQAQAELSRMVHWFNKRDNVALVLKRIANRKADPEGADLLDNVGTLYLLLKPIYEKNKGAYEALQQKEDAA